VAAVKLPTKERGSHGRGKATRGTGTITPDARRTLPPQPRPDPSGGVTKDTRQNRGPVRIAWSCAPSTGRAQGTAPATESAPRAQKSRPGQGQGTGPSRAGPRQAKTSPRQNQILPPITRLAQKQTGPGRPPDTRTQTVHNQADQDNPANGNNIQWPYHSDAQNPASGPIPGLPPSKIKTGIPKWVRPLKGVKPPGIPRTTPLSPTLKAKARFGRPRTEGSQSALNWKVGNLVPGEPP